uniref:Uncharacterized protein n=1 Tax=Callorhinchus milii TaxID=7868 RepID=A0A4W3GAD5_CALMI
RLQRLQGLDQRQDFESKTLGAEILPAQLGGNNLTSESTEDLVSDLSINHSLTELDMSNNQLRDYGVKRLSEALRNPECKIQRLRLQGNSLTSDYTKELDLGLSTNRSLTELNLNDNKLGDCGVKRLCEALRNPECKIRSLALGGNNLTAHCTENLASALSTNHSLSKLDLSNNKLRDYGVRQLCEALKKAEFKVGYTHSVFCDPCCVSVSLISRLNSNKLTVRCTKAMASTLIKNPSLTELNLNNNKLRDCGVKRLCVALRNPECKIQSLGYVAHCVSRTVKDRETENERERPRLRETVRER